MAVNNALRCVLLAQVQHMRGTQMIERLLTPDEVADILRTTTGGLKYNRHVGRGPRYVKAGRRVLYPESAISEFLIAGVIVPTSRTS